MFALIECSNAHEWVYKYFRRLMMSNMIETAIAECAPCQCPPVALMPNPPMSNGQTIFGHPTQEPPVHSIVASLAAVPTQEPPAQQGQQGAVAAGWQTDKKVAGLYRTCGADRNSWMYVEGIGWRKFLETSDSATTAFSIIAAHAKTTNKTVNYYEGDDGKVNTLYVF
jgi:hypothetical protein